MEFNVPHTGRMAYILEINLVNKLCSKSIEENITFIRLALPDMLRQVLKKKKQTFKAIKIDFMKKGMHKQPSFHI